ncbi:MAG: hypothetical protein HOL01_10970 [Planctomycetaceae bacterium]|nr:hypothetical protein [Planctomycetaceae bacterium]MBT6487943.1 hypothetical protein [Planctomycetaceae bacterium]MBT6495060.1 hypothetical protein [Planctomycetaceae bacterium]
MDGMLPYILAGVLAAIAVAVAVAWKPVTARLRAREVKQAIGLFRLQREQLEAKFFDLASMQGKPRGLRWMDCDWQNGVTFARDVHSKMLTAFVAVNITFEALEGSDMEEVEAVGTIREAAAVFHYSRKRWGTGGRPLFNMNAEDAVVRLQGQFEAVSADA